MIERQILPHVLESAELGLRCFPLLPGRKTPRWEGFTEWATTDPQRLTAHWMKYPTDNYGTLFVGEGLVGLDLDLYQLPVREWLEQHSECDWHQTRTTTTPGRGIHRIYELPDGLRGTRNRDISFGIELKIWHKYLVGVGSYLDPYEKEVIRPDGSKSVEMFSGTYELDRDVAPGIASAPAWLVDFIAEHCQERQEQNRVYGGIALQSKKIPPGTRNDWLTKEAGRLINRYPADAVRSMVVALNAAVCDPPLDDSELERTVLRSLESWAGASTPLLPRLGYDPSRLIDATELRVSTPRRAIVGSAQCALLPEQGSLLIVGPEQSGKTTVLQHLALALHSGAGWLGFRTERRTTLLIGVDRPESAKDSWLKLAAGRPLERGAVFTYFGALTDLLAEPDVIPSMAQKCGAEVVILDGIYALAPPAVSLSDDIWGRALARLVAELNSAGIAVVAAGHPPRKREAAGDRISAAHGSRFQSAAFDSVLTLSGQHGTVRVSHVKGTGQPAPEFMFLIDSGSRAIRRTDREPSSLEIARSLSQITVSEFAAAGGVSRSKARNLLNALEAQGHLLLIDEGQSGGKAGGQPRRWKLA